MLFFGTRHTLVVALRFPLVANHFRMRNPHPSLYPDASLLAALRAWYAGMPSREAVERYCPSALGDGTSARGVLSRLRRQLADFSVSRHRDDLAKLFQCAAAERIRYSKAVTRALENLPSLPLAQPQISDPINAWLPLRAVGALRQHGIKTLADLTVRIPRRQRWWSVIPGLGLRSARRIEAFFAAHPALTERARALVAAAPVVPWEHIRLPHGVDGSQGVFVHHGKCVRSRLPTTTKPSALGSHDMKRQRRSARIAGKPSACCCGRSSNVERRCLR